MGLTCECDNDWWPDPGDWMWSERPDGYKKFPFKVRRKCSSCHELINIGALAVEHYRVRIPDTDIEVRIYGDDGEIPIASDWMCERCGDLYFSLTELGYCVNPRDDMRGLIEEYVNEHTGIQE